MKNIYRLFTTATVITLLVFNSCVPEDEIVVDYVPIITNGVWKFKEVDDKDQDLKEFYEGFYVGREIVFKADGTFTQNLNIYNTSGNWKFDDNQTILQYDFGTSKAEDWKIINISESEIYFEFEISPNIIKIRYTH
jgi:hypothetical protein